MLGTHHSLRTFWRFWRGMNLSHPCQRDLRMSNCAAEVKYGDQKSPWNLLCFFPHDYIWLYMCIMIYSAMCVSASLSLSLPSAKQMYFRLPGWSGRGCLDKSAFPLVGKQLVTINLFFDTTDHHPSRWVVAKTGMQFLGFCSFKSHHFCSLKSNLGNYL